MKGSELHRSIEPLSDRVDIWRAIISFTVHQNRHSFRGHTVLVILCLPSSNPGSVLILSDSVQFPEWWLLVRITQAPLLTEFWWFQLVGAWKGVEVCFSYTPSSGPQPWVVTVPLYSWGPGGLVTSCFSRSSVPMGLWKPCFLPLPLQDCVDPASLLKPLIHLGPSLTCSNILSCSLLLEMNSRDKMTI